MSIGINELLFDNKNSKDVYCQYCNSLILKSKMGRHFEIEFNLPLIHQKNTRKIGEIEKELLKEFWFVDDIFTFENIGFSNTVETTKFLICGDCDMGPVGYHDIKTGKSYIALSRVKHI